MRTSRLILLLISLILIAGFLRLGSYLVRDLEAQTLQATEESMNDSARILAGLVEVRGLEPLRESWETIKTQNHLARIYQIEKKTSGLDFYLTDDLGRIVYDSSGRFPPGTDVSKWNDVARTLAGRYGSRSTRWDESDETSSIMYVGAPVRDRTGKTIVGCLTVYKAQADVLPFVHSRSSDIVFALVSIAAAIIALVIAVFTFLFRPLGRLTNYARGITEGKRLPLPPLGRGREVNTLGNALQQMKEALEGRHYVENYVQTLTHELKSPLAAIQGAAEILKESPPEPDRLRFLTNIIRETERCARLIQQLLTLTSIEAAAPAQPTTQVDLPQLLEKTLEQHQERAAIKNQALGKPEFPEQLPSLTGHSGLISSALGSIIENALEHSPASSTISSRIYQKEDIIYLEVENRTEHIPNFVYQRAFERFFSYHADGSSKGNGLGLSLTASIMELHGGSAELLTHDDDEGSRIIVCLVFPPQN